ncbi:unnamed protein product [Phytomonas sp. EM1]|nr:unnamed protein product [Phytomonas sp. EM1]|eukprot:CCW65554.1 unnamed protein product [Phytomonas sp. isolate EM1]
MINEEVYLFCPQLRLIPYLPHHVPRYNEWMSDPALLAATESEPLSLQEEYENQHSWLRSMEKLTFILATPLSGWNDPTREPSDSDGFDRTHPALRDQQGPFNDADETVQPLLVRREGPWVCSPRNPRPFAWKAIRAWFPLIAEDDEVSFEPVSADDPARIPRPPLAGSKPLPARFIPTRPKNLFTGEALPSGRLEGFGNPSVGKPSFVMIGDCNLFVLPEEVEDGEGEGRPSPSRPSDRRTFEVEVMIAYPPYRHHGLAERALRMLMQYATAALGGTDFVAKILDTNTASLHLFARKLGFREFKRVAVFHEIHYTRSIYTAAEKQIWAAECAAAGCGDCGCAAYTADVEQNMVLLARNPSRC